ncbi:MAG: hypothetical protein P4L16_03415 [Chlamydiales bacterium]|nr:hypothetical protein [Chlamydiales bacterium]
MLLEMLVAITIALLCIVPLLVSHVRLYQEEAKWFEQVQLERWADLSYLEVSEIVQESPELVRKKGVVQFLQSPAEVYLGHGKMLLFERSYVIKDAPKAEENLQTESGLNIIDLDILFSLKKSKERVYAYPYRFIVDYEKK